MATTQLTAGQVMDRMASLLNDTAKSNYTYVNMLPYLKMATDDLVEQYALNNLPITNKKSAVIDIPALTSAINPSTGSAPTYPADMIEIQQLWESPDGQNSWIPMYRSNFIPNYLTSIRTNNIVFWAWENQVIVLQPANAANDIKMDYIAALFTTIADHTTELGVINSLSYLSFQGAAYIAKYVEQNETRAMALMSDANDALDRALGISVKGQQSIAIRRIPFRSRR